MELVQSLGDLYSRFGAMRIVHPFAERAFRTLDAMRECKRLSRRREEQLAGTFFADSHAGKSTTIRMYLETVIAPECIARGMFPVGASVDDVLELQKIVLFIELPPDTTLKGLMISVLRALNDPNPTYGDVDRMIDRVGVLMRQHNVELLIFDEIDHLKVPLPRTHAQSTQATKVHKHLKSLLRQGYPIMFVGIPEARKKLFEEKQAVRREMHRIDIPVLNYSNEEHHRIFMDFCADLGIILQEKGIMREVSDFLGDDLEIMACLFEASERLLGGVVRIVEKASEYAFVEGAPRVERWHLENATDFQLGFSRRNPFRNGLSAAELVRH